MKISDKTKIESIDLNVRDLEKSLNFYNSLLGFRIIENDKNKALLSADGKLPFIISLEQKPDATTNDRHAAGLYHTAFLFPDRNALGKVFLHLHENGVKFHGFSDHIVSEAIYLGDPDGNGVELYVDKPNSEWHWISGQINMDTLPLNLNLITNEVLDRDEPWNGIDPRVTIGHIHLRVTDLLKAEKFYSNTIGFNVTNSTYGGAIFMSAGGYHHHIGTNIWNSSNGPHHSENSLGLKSFTIKIPDSIYIEELKSRFKKSGLEFFELNGNKYPNGVQVKDYDSIIVKIVS